MSKFHSLNRAIATIVLRALSLAVLCLIGDAYSAEPPTIPSTKVPLTATPNSADSKAADQHRNRQIKATIEAWEEHVRKKLDVIDEMYESFDFHKVQSQKVVSSELLSMLDHLDEGASSIIQSFEALGPDLELYRKALLAAPPAFQKLGDEMERNALSKRSIDIQKTYADFAAQTRKLAAAYEKRAQGVDELESVVQEKIEFVRESRDFIHDVKAIWDTIPAESGLETERLVERLNRYVDSFQEAVRTMRNVADKIVEPTSKTPTQVMKPTTQASSNAKGSVSHPTSLFLDQFKALNAIGR